MATGRFDLHRHLEKQHNVSPISTYLREIVYGGNDGIVTTFAVVAGFAGAEMQSAGSLPLLVVLLFGFANLFADGLSMALGNFLSTRSEQDVYRSEKAKELHEIRTNPAQERAESLELLMQKGYDREDAEKLVALYSKNERYWLDFMMTQELEMANPENDKPTHMAFATFVSFVGFGLIPLLPYIFFRHLENLFTLSVIATIIALLILGFLRWRVTKIHIVRSMGETLLLGGAAATVAYLVGTAFRV
jgi:vacuolar iron transporter family protein